VSSADTEQRYAPGWLCDDDDEDEDDELTDSNQFLNQANSVA